MGIDTYEFKRGFNEQSNYLDLGCGIGRHLMYGLDVGFNVTGIDLSEVAVQTAKRYISTHPKVKGNEQVIATSATAMPFKNGSFDIIVSHGVLDSMPYVVAKEVVKETARVISLDGIFYCDLISGEFKEFYEEEEVTVEHERGTIQSYFNLTKIKHLFEEYFEIIECRYNTTKFEVGDYYGDKAYGRYHVVLKKKRKMI